MTTTLRNPLASELLSSIHTSIDKRQQQFINLCKADGDYKLINTLKNEINALQSSSIAIINIMSANGDWELTESELRFYTANL